jgi:hypothetical protein
MCIYVSVYFHHTIVAHRSMCLPFFRWFPWLGSDGDTYGDKYLRVWAARATYVCTRVSTKGSLTCDGLHPRSLVHSTSATTACSTCWTDTDILPRTRIDGAWHRSCLPTLGLPPKKHKLLTIRRDRPYGRQHNAVSIRSKIYSSRFSPAKFRGSLS